MNVQVSGGLPPVAPVNHHVYFRQKTFVDGLLGPLGGDAGTAAVDVSQDVSALFSAAMGESYAAVVSWFITNATARLSLLAKIMGGF